MKIRIEIDGIMYIPSLGGCSDCALQEYCTNDTDITFISLCNAINDRKHNFKIDENQYN